MIVCSCNAFSDKEVQGCLAPGPGCPRTPAQVYRCLGCSPQCGRCAATIRTILMQETAGTDASSTSSCPGSCCGAKAAPKATPWKKRGTLAALAPSSASFAPWHRNRTAGENQEPLQAAARD